MSLTTFNKGTGYQKGMRGRRWCCKESQPTDSGPPRRMVDLPVKWKRPVEVVSHLHHSRQKDKDTHRRESGGGRASVPAAARDLQPWRRSLSDIVMVTKAIFAHAVDSGV